jgi:hypothetical protein
VTNLINRLIWPLRMLTWTVGAIVLTWPVATAPTRLVIGGAGAWRGLWTGWALTSGETTGYPWMTGTSLLSWPLGTATISPSPLGDLARAPLTGLIGAAATWNLTILLHVLIAGAGGSWLARRVGLGIAGATVAGSTVAFAPYLWTAGAASGALDVFAGAWVPWVFSAIVVMAQRPGPVPAAALIVAWWLCGVSDAHLAILLPLMVPCVLAPALAQDWTAEANRWRAAAGALVAIIVALGITSATLRPMVEVVADPLARLPFGTLGDGRLDTPAEMSAVATGSLTGGLLPGGGNLVVDASHSGSMLTVYAGWACLGLAVLGLGPGRLRWGVLGVVAGLVVMGPYLYIEPQIGRQAPLPLWWLLDQHWSGFNLMTIPARAMAFATVALGVLAGAGFDRILNTRLLRSPPAGAGLLLSVVLLADTSLLSPAPFPVPSTAIETSGAAIYLANQPGTEPVLTLPSRTERNGAAAGQWLTDQMHHRRPLIWDLSGATTQTRVESNSLIVALESAALGTDARTEPQTGLEDLPLTTGAGALEQMGLLWVVVYTRDIEPARVSSVLALLDAHTDRVAAWEDGSVLYQVRSSELSRAR